MTETTLRIDGKTSGFLVIWHDERGACKLDIFATRTLAVAVASKSAKKHGDHVVVLDLYTRERLYACNYPGFGEKERVRATGRNKGTANPPPEIAPEEMKRIRLALDLTQEQMARRLGLGKRGQQTVGAWERGKWKPRGPALVAYEEMRKRAAKIRAKKRG